MRSLVQSTIASAALMVAFGISTAKAQEPPTVGVVSIANLDKVTNDISYMIEATNFREFSALFTLSANQYTQGINRDKPLGAIIKLDGQTPLFTVFMAMDDVELFFQALEGLGIEPDDLGDGLYEIDTGAQVIYCKTHNGWMFVAQSENELSNLPDDPSQELRRLPEKYDLAIQINVSKVPDELKEAAIEQIRMGYENSLAQAGQEVNEEMAEAQIEQMQQMMSDTDQLIVGWAVDQSGQKTYFDGAVLFKEGTKLAQQVADSMDTTSKYAKFILPQASAKFRFTAAIPEGERETAKANFRNSMKSAAEQATQNAPPEAQEVLEEFMAGFGKIMEDTIDEGMFDGAGSVSVANDELKVLIGGLVADGNALAEEFKKLAAKKPEGEPPTFEFDYSTYKDVTLHKVTGPVSGDDAVKEVLGDEITIVIGTSDKGYIIALADDSDKLAKQAIDGLEKAEAVKAPPFEGVIRVEDFMKFAQTISPNPMLENALNTISEYDGKDKVEINGQLIPRGGVYRFSMDEGVLRTIGAAARGGGGGGGF